MANKPDQVIDPRTSRNIKLEKVVTNRQALNLEINTTHNRQVSRLERDATVVGSRINLEEGLMLTLYKYMRPHTERRAKGARQRPEAEKRRAPKQRNAADQTHAATHP